MKRKILKFILKAEKIQIIAAALSAIFLGISTGITTLQIPKVDQHIANEDSEIKNLRYVTTKDLVQGLYAMDQYTERRMNLIDIRLERMMNASRTKLEESLLKDIWDNTLAQIDRWNSLFLLEQQQKTDNHNLQVDPNTPIEKRILTIDRDLTRARTEAYYRLNKLIIQANEHELYKAGYDKTLKSLERRFRIFQMIGLFTLVIAVGLEAYTKLNEEKKIGSCEHVVSADVPDGPPQEKK